MILALMVVPANTEASGPYPQYGWDFPEKVPEKFEKDPGNALRAFPGIPLERTAEVPQTLSFKASEASRAFQNSPPQYGWARLFFQKWFRRGPLRAVVLEFPAALRVFLSIHKRTHTHTSTHSLTLQHSPQVGVLEGGGLGRGGLFFFFTFRSLKNCLDQSTLCRGPPTIYRHHKGAQIKRRISKGVVYELSEPKRTAKCIPPPGSHWRCSSWFLWGWCADCGVQICPFTKFS